ncbi:YhjD/YihY/BrkB family envelope integrity protein [Kitasatospora sp. NPDC058032]|uniref:YhjD/YihY/BrkB family envelope integrity protein n=1 Tax=Kitasatospora sp. NPDC058032 TaxID=3346307 RepID=UPI0036D9D5F0
MSEQPNGQPAGPGGGDDRDERDEHAAHDERRTARWRHRSAALAGSARGLPDQVPMVGRALHQLLRVNLLDSATRLAAQAFLSALPALFVVAVFAPTAIRNGVVHSLRKELGLQGQAAHSVQQMLGSGHEQETGFGMVGALVTLLSATALSRAMQRVCERCWELPRSGTRVAAWRWLAWLLVWLVCLAFQTPVKDGFGLGAWLGVPLTFLLATALWWWTQHLLLGARVRWLPLLPGALLCGVGVVGIGVASRVYLPAAMNRSIGNFGPFGVVFTGLSWLIVVFTGLTLAIALGRVVAEEEAVARLLGSRTAPGQWGGPRF